ncbi:hypothetical protein QYE76_052155 [Lolium multiflorum]|uniref:Retrotransposon gag domain-containing protein n=1 Tax=Lolium multiflorum TaxID=4521 RepID=A0AAD8SUT1_LOLMU|nr:hypothetical protein QYE76_052155 [Lolium multiflorum]
MSIVEEEADPGRPTRALDVLTMPVPSHMDMRGHALDTRRAATTRTPWPLSRRVERQHATTTPPDTRTAQTPAGARQYLTSPPTIGAAPGAAAGARSFAVVYTFPEHTASHRGSPVPRMTVGHHWEAKLMGRGAHTRMEPYVQTETYDLENGGSLVFERDLYLVSERLERPPPKFHGVRIHDTPTGEQQWMITADLKGSSEPPVSERILFSFKACNWPDGLAHALQEGLARVCGQHIAALRGSRFAYFARHDTMGEPMAPSSHPVLMIHVGHLDLMLHETRKDLERTRVHNQHAQMTVAHHAEAIRMLAKDRKLLRLQRAKKDATIRRLREKIRTLEVTVRTQQDQIQEMEEDGDDIQGGDDFLSDDNDFEDDEFTMRRTTRFWSPRRMGSSPSMWTLILRGLIKKMRDEFRELKQGRMSVVEYRDRFLTLSRYAPMKPTPMRKGRKDS